MLLWPKQTLKAKRDYSQTWKQEYPEKYLLTLARARAKAKEREFDIDISDVVIPAVCPYLKTPFIANTMYAASVDRIDSKRGYVKGNIEVISRKANVMKNDASVEELLQFAYEILERY